MARRHVELAGDGTAAVNAGGRPPATASDRSSHHPPAGGRAHASSTLMTPAPTCEREPTGRCGAVRPRRVSRRGRRQRAHCLLRSGNRATVTGGPVTVRCGVCTRPRPQPLHGTHRWHRRIAQTYCTLPSTLASLVLGAHPCSLYDFPLYPGLELVNLFHFLQRHVGMVTAVVVLCIDWWL